VAKAGHALSAVNAAVMGGSHPLAERIGAWPAVVAVTGVTVAAAGPSPAPQAASSAAARQRQSRTAPPSTVSTVPVTKRLSIRWRWEAATSPGSPTVFG
jgi:hypothetical protein